MAKKFKLAPEQIQPLLPNRGGCLATDMITVEGLGIGWMYREKPVDRLDSGWRFYAGRESRAYLEDPGHSAPYDLNILANYEPAIIPLMDAPVGSAFRRGGPGTPFQPFTYWRIADAY